MTIDDQISCVQREIRMRERVYPPRVAEGKINPHHAERELLLMRAVLQTLLGVLADAPPRVTRKAL